MSGEEEAGALQPVEQRTVDFYGDELVAVRDEAGTVWVPVRRVCDLLGVDWSGQRQRIMRDPILSEALISVGVTPTQTGRGQGEREALAWLKAWLDRLR